MNLCTLKAWQAAQLLADGSITARELTKAYTTQNDSFNAFITRTSEFALRTAEHVDKLRAAHEKLPPLAGVPIAVKDNICVKGYPCTCASKMLAHFKPPYDATAAVRIKSNLMPILGKTNMDEFAMGSTGETSFFGATDNPKFSGYSPGGSSSGSAAAVAGGLAPFAIGSDTGGSVRQPAAHCGLVGFKPSFGAISRFGLVAFASSLDQIGILARDVRDIELLTHVLFGSDVNDQTSIEISNVKQHSLTRVGTLSCDKACSDIRKSVLKASELLESKQDFDMPYSDYLLSIYYIISSAEAASNLARYDGIGYGYRALDVQSVDELIERSREDGFGREAKRRISFGSFALSATQYDDVYEKACKARLLVTRELDKLFENTDILLAPTCISKPQMRGEPLKYEADYYTVLANLTGAAAITVCGVQLIAKRGNDELLIETARILEARLGGDNNDV